MVKQQNSVKTLLLFQNIAEDSAVQLAESLFDAWAGSETSEKVVAFERAMLADYERAAGGAADLPRVNVWQLHLLTLLAEAENAFTAAAERGAVPEPVRALAESELKYLLELYNVASGKTKPEDVATWEVALPGYLSRMGLAEAMTAPDAAQAAALLAEAYRQHGVGRMCRYDAFIWDGGLGGTDRVDPTTFADLIGMEAHKAALTQCAEKLLAGGPVPNILLYGDSGTGKSSSVKALLNAYREKGLKLVALSREQIGELPRLLGILAESSRKFLVYIDDLSFEENDTSYKTFKSVIEGGVRARPGNVLLIVTSNRRNIIKEVWKDREGTDDVHLRDNLQEKRSLADRFGLTLVYLSPAKKEYLDIVAGLAERAGIRMDKETLTREALQWEIRHGGRSGRTARQFVESLQA
jgi:predicted AAA+ superfamily ATPase